MATCGQVQFLVFFVKAGETGRHQRALVDVLLAVDLLLRLDQQLQHFAHDGLQRTAQVFTTVRLSKRRHVDEGGVPAAQVQGRVVGEVTEIPIKGQQHRHGLWPTEQRRLPHSSSGYQLPSCVFGDRHGHSQPRGGHPLADRFHVDDGVDAVRAPNDAALGIWTEAAVVQAPVAVIPAALLQRDGGGHSRHPDVNDQLKTKQSWR